MLIIAGLRTAWVLFGYQCPGLLRTAITNHLGAKNLLLAGDEAHSQTGDAVKFTQPVRVL
jgi:hypothetical protein